MLDLELEKIAEGFRDGRDLKEPEDDDDFYQIGHQYGVLLRIQLDSEGGES